MIYNLFEKGLGFIAFVIAYLSVNNNHSKNRLACELDMQEYDQKSGGQISVEAKAMKGFSVLDSFSGNSNFVIFFPG